jgi:thiaminase
MPFLEAFGRAYSITAAKAPDWEGFSVFHSLADGVLTELRLHQGYAAAWELICILLNRNPRHVVILTFVSYRLGCGFNNCCHVTLYVLVWLLGQQLAQDGIPEHHYGEWIRTYSSQSLGSWLNNWRVWLIATLAPHRLYIRLIDMQCCVNEIFFRQHGLSKGLKQ